MMAITSKERTLRGAGRSGSGPVSRMDAVLGHPAAFLATAVLLLTLFGWTFGTNPDRVAPTKDPAYYSWRTEVLISEPPVRLLELEGAFDMFAGGYRVTAPVIGGLIRHIPGVSNLNVTVLMTVGLPVFTALLLAGFAFSHLRDPLVFHSVALASASLFLTPPFIGYLDNMLCLFFIAAALPFISGTRDSWPARVVFGLFLVLAGLTHPTTLAIFCLTLGAMAAVRLLFRRFDLRSVIGDDGPMLATAFVGAVVALAIWTVGIWGQSASLTEAALSPPYGSAFFLNRLDIWIDTMRPALNGPLFLIGAAGLLAAGRRAVDNELARISIVWLAPLAGVFGFLAGLAYPYYRFFNTTLAWVLLVGVGAYFAVRYFIEVAALGGAHRLALLGVGAIVVLIGTNFSTGFDTSGWTRSEWLGPDARRDLDVLRSELAAQTDEDTPVVFVIDDEPGRPFQIWGFTKLSGNTARYGLPPGQIDQAYVYLGSLENYLAGEPTTRGDDTYDDLSPELLEYSETGLSGTEPLVVVAEIFNPAGANAGIASGEEDLIVPADPQGVEQFERLWVLHDGTIDRIGESVAPRLSDDDPGPLHLVRAVIGMALLMVPGALAFRYVLPGSSVAEAIGVVPALGLGGSVVAAIALLAVARGPFSATLAWIALLVATAVPAALLVAARRRSVVRSR
jgi:hypothetical protein